MKKKRSSKQRVRKIRTEKNKIVSVDVVKELQIDPNRIEVALCTHASRYEYFRQLLEDAKSRTKTAKLRLETIESQLYITIQEELEQTGRRVVDLAIKAERSKTPTWQRAQKAVYRCEREEGTLKSICSGFEHRSEMIRSLALLRHSELKHNVAIISGREQSE